MSYGEEAPPPWEGATGVARPAGGFQRAPAQGGRGRPRKNNEGGDRGDYVEVKDRIAEFYTKHPTGSIQTEILVDMSQVEVVWESVQKTRGDGADRKTVTLEKPGMRGVVTVKASVWRSPDDPRPCTGHSWFPMPGQTPYTELSELENAETSAVGRALAMAGISVNKGISSGTEIRGKGSESDDTELEADAAFQAWQAEQAKTAPAAVAPEPNVTTGTPAEPQAGAQAPLTSSHVPPGQTEPQAAEPQGADPATGEVLEGAEAVANATPDGTEGLTAQALADAMRAAKVGSVVIVARSQQMFGHSKIRELTDEQRGQMWAAVLANRTE